MMPEDAGALFVRLCLSGPLLYIGLVMLMDAARFFSSVEALASATRTMERRLHGIQWQEPRIEPAPMDDSPLARIVVRIAGLALVLFSLLHLSGVLF